MAYFGKITGKTLSVVVTHCFAIWERRSRGGRNVTFPSRQYSVNGERRSFQLLRAIGDASAQEAVKALVIEAYAEHEKAATQVA